MTERNQVSETLCLKDPRWTVSKMIITLTSSFHLYNSCIHVLIPAHCQFDLNVELKVLRYKSEGRWFDSRWCHWNFSLT